MKIRNYLILLLLSFVVIFTGCEKDSDNNNEVVSYDDYYRIKSTDKPSKGEYGIPKNPTWGFVKSTASSDMYNSLDGLKGRDLYLELKKIAAVNTSRTSYDRYRYTSTDEDPRNTNNIILIYTGWSVAKSDTYKWNREHVFACSNGKFKRGSRGAGADNHHIRCSDPSENSSRGNDKLGVGYIPRKAVQGDVARMTFYVSLVYDIEPEWNVDVKKNLEWNKTDKVDDWEMKRNNVINKNQGNRNPFIDHPELIDYIYGNKTDVVYRLK